MGCRCQWEVGRSGCPENRVQASVEVHRETGGRPEDMGERLETGWGSPGSAVHTHSQ